MRTEARLDRSLEEQLQRSEVSGDTRASAPKGSIRLMENPPSLRAEPPTNVYVNI